MAGAEHVIETCPPQEGFIHGEFHEFAGQEFLENLVTGVAEDQFVKYCCAVWWRIVFLGCFTLTRQGMLRIEPRPVVWVKLVERDGGLFPIATADGDAGGISFDEFTFNGVLTI